MTAFRPTKKLPKIVIFGTFREAVDEAIKAIEPHVILPKDGKTRAMFMPAITELARHMCMYIRMAHLAHKIHPFESQSKPNVYPSPEESFVRLSESPPYVTIAKPGTEVGPGDLPSWRTRSTSHQTAVFISTDPATRQPIPGAPKRVRSLKLRSIPLPWKIAPDKGKLVEHVLVYKISAKDTIMYNKDGGGNPRVLVDLVDLFEPHACYIDPDEAAGVAKTFSTGKPDANDDELQMHCKSISDATRLVIFSMDNGMARDPK
jgi:hypothetical protein